MQCKKCGMELRENAKFCLECGEKVIKELKCKQCGNILVPNSKFCDECGTKVDYSIDNSASEKKETITNSNALERNAEKDSKIENNKKVFNEYGLRKVSLKSTGKMGYFLAEEARDRGANVVLVSGPTNLTPPKGVKVININSFWRS